MLAKLDNHTLTINQPRSLKDEAALLLIQHTKLKQNPSKIVVLLKPQTEKTLKLSDNTRRVLVKKHRKKLKGPEIILRK